MQIQTSALKGYQEESVQFLSQHSRVLLGLAPGLGKTRCAIEAALDLKLPNVLIVAPLSLLRTWQNEIKKWSGESSTIVHRALCPPYPEYGIRFTITNYDTLRRNQTSFLRKWDCIIIDESLIVKNPTALRTKAVNFMVNGGNETTEPDYVWELSGAPTSRFYDDLWSQLNILAPKRFSSYWNFAFKFCLVDEDFKVYKNKPSVDLKKSLKDVFFARTQEEALDLPPFIFEDMVVPMSKSQTKAYNTMEEGFYADLENGDTLLAPNKLSQMVRLVQFASNPELIEGFKYDSQKWDSVKEIIDFTSGPHLIWTSFIHTAVTMEKMLTKHGLRVRSLVGGTSPEDRQKTVDDFQNGDLDVIVAHPGVGKYGLTLTRARTAIYLERSYNADDYYQSLHRVRRIGTTQSPHIVHLLSSTFDGKTTIDMVIGKILEMRRDSVIDLTSGLIWRIAKEVT